MTDEKRLKDLENRVAWLEALMFHLGDGGRHGQFMSQWKRWPVHPWNDAAREAVLEVDPTRDHDEL